MRAVQAGPWFLLGALACGGSVAPSTVGSTDGHDADDEEAARGDAAAVDGVASPHADGETADGQTAQGDSSSSSSAHDGALVCDNLTNNINRAADGSCEE